ncbi:hypothetical protein [Sphingomonas astaxanthinifaciens]|uniref:Uncharacterized protein n=1 Tax=Sphingomonas astaxanthinifaciens DSM 22298 TaxID=1123267 RepID=A0ABQ5Z7T7_9SPHN|nr:hypothetical protein [Sphingomonas astaxanthinifaciens]GLR46923.1 hypothetical protein GCM10007925_06340 [Sphingomonas astaxanthinifaciens DSM 22298]
MRDELFDRDFQGGREALNEGIDRLIARIGAFVRATGEAQVRAEWSAPWARSGRRNRSGVA